MRGLESDHHQSKGKFKAGLSISGITLTLLQRYAPEVIARLSFLKENDYVELISETWSNSAVACFNENSYRRQVQQHDRLMQSYFGEVPQLLYVNSPVYPDDFIDTISGWGKGQYLSIQICWMSRYLKSFLVPE